MSLRRTTAVVLGSGLLLLAACTGGAADSEPRADTPAPTTPSEAEATAVPAPGPRTTLVSASPGRPVVRPGEDWSMPAWVRPAPDSGFFSEDASELDDVYVRSVDVSWKQIAPGPDEPLDLTSAGSAQGLSMEPLGTQLAEPGPYWVRIFASGVDWAPEWVLEDCDVSGVGTDYDGQQHIPIWDDCVWDALRTTWQQLLQDQGVLDDPDFQFAYVPGGFTWVEFDFDVISQAERRGAVDQDIFLTWFDTMLEDLAGIAGESVGRLVFTGEDYPWGPFGSADDLLAARAVEHGFGVRTGITEVSNFHLSETPAYGSSVTADGHLEIGPRPSTGAEGRVTATENECYDDCGFHATDPEYAVIASNLKALQLQMNWLYVVPGPSKFPQLPDHWDWMRLSLGHDAEDAPDAWVALRDAEDTFWRDEQGPFGPGGRPWPAKPWVRNLERWLVQRDVGPHAVPVRSRADVHRGELTPENGAAYEGLRTALARGSDSLAFDLDPAFLDPGRAADVLVKVTYFDDGQGRWYVRHSAGRTPAVRLDGSGEWETATLRLTALTPDGSLPGGTDVWITAEGADLDVRFVRVVRLTAPE